MAIYSYKDHFVVNLLYNISLLKLPSLETRLFWERKAGLILLEICFCFWSNFVFNEYFSQIYMFKKNWELRTENVGFTKTPAIVLKGNPHF